jgi:hypothetical protein
VGKNARIGIAAGVVVVLALLFALTGNVVIGGGILVVGGLGVAAVYQRLPQDDDDGETPAPPRRKTATGPFKSKLDKAIEDRGEDKSPRLRARPSKPPATTGGLPTWSPAGLDTWTPPVDDEPAVAEPAPSAKDASSWDSWDDDWDSETVVEEHDTEEENPLSALEGLDEVDPVAEVERLEGLSGSEERTAPQQSGFSFASAPAVINEETIETADDIMAASEAMELHVDEVENGDSELAKLLAKVQARLAAYE